MHCCIFFLLKASVLSKYNKFMSRLKGVRRDPFEAQKLQTAFFVGVLLDL